MLDSVSGPQQSVTSQSSSALTPDGERRLAKPETPSSPPSNRAKTLEGMLRTPPHLRGGEVIEEIEHALTKWSRYGVDLPRAVRLELCKYMGFASFGAGECIFKQGDTGEHFYIILNGAVAVSVYTDEDNMEEKVVAHLLAGASFGELALMQGHGQRRATCRCSQKSELFVVDIKDFKRILQPLQHDTLQAKIAFLQTVPLFQGMAPADIESLAVVLTEKVYPPKSVVCYQGNEVEDLYFIQRGHVKLVRETKMAAQIRPSSSRTATQQAVTSSSSTIPAWLADDDCKPSPRSSAAAQRSDGPVSCLYSRSGRSKGARLGSAVPPSYHKLSLELIKSMSDKAGDKLNSKCGSEAGALLTGRPARRAPASAGSRRSLHPASCMSLSTIRPGSASAASQQRRSTLKFAASAALPDQEDPSAPQAAAGKERNWLMSEQTLDQHVVQRLEFARNLRVKQHLFLEVDYLNKGEFFGDVAVTKTPIAQTTFVASGMTTILLVISKWDLAKRVPKETLDYLAERGRASVLDDNTVRSDYVACQEWLRPHLRSVEDITEIKYALTKWSKYGMDLPKPSRLELCKYMGFASYLAGEVILKQGDSGDHFYIILSGAVNVAVNQEKQVTDPPYHTQKE
ncbi:Rap guanine nucleotide exchange factor-like 1 [Trebouxia sp. C0009 RCD-2024]